MKLVSITPHFFRPFAEDACLELDPEVTALTGANDSGKSAIIRLVLLCMSEQSLEEADVNEHYLSLPGKQWDRNHDVGATFRLRITHSNDPATYLNEPDVRTFRLGDELEFRACLAPSARGQGFFQFLRAYRDGASLPNAAQRPRRLPAVLRLPPDGEVSNIVDLTNPRPLEKSLLALAFGHKSAKYEIGRVDPRRFSLLIDQAEERVNKRLQQMLPRSNPLHLTIRPIRGEERHKVAFELTDQWGGQTAFGARGTGVRRMLAILTTLADRDVDQDVILLMDEPENSLHADSQHLLRTTLESLASTSRVQVLYATHSPSMLNPMRPSTIKLLQRAESDGAATTKIINQPVHGTYEAVRSNLGISATDGLVYGPVSVVLEGISDIYAVGTLLSRLAIERRPEFLDANALLAQCTMIDGRGDELIRIARVAQRHGTKVVLFVDGDKRRFLAAEAAATALGGAPIVAFQEGKELEDIVSREDYFVALRRALGPDRDIPGFSLDAYLKWEATAKLATGMMTSKRIQAWLYTLDPELDVPKTRAMRICVETVPLERFATEILQALVASIRKRLDDPWSPPVDAT